MAIGGKDINIRLELRFLDFENSCMKESRAVARKPRDTAAVLLGLKFVDNIYCNRLKFKSSQVSKARLQCSKHTVAK